MELKLKHQQTENSFLAAKIKIRLECINKVNKDKVKILDCFHASGRLYSIIEKLTNKKLDVIGIEIDKNKKSKFKVLYGDNLKYLNSINLQEFDIIDLDAFGTPVKQLEIILNKDVKCFVIFTFIIKVFGMLNFELLNKLGYSKAMINKVPSLFCRNGFDKFKKYLTYYGISNIKYIDKQNSKKIYAYFKG